MNTILIFGGIVCFLGFVLVLVVYYFWKFHNRSDVDYLPSGKFHQKVGEEKREHPRANINWPVSMETVSGTIDAEVKNISISGAFICCKNPLPLGEVFRLTMTCPDNELMAATAAVVWSNTNVPEDKVINRGMGIRFIKMSDRHIQSVKQIFQENG
jgi:hypothetical protein